MIAIVCSDIHLQAKPPVARSAEPDWFEAMAHTLDQVKEIADKHKVPTIIAGDLFDRWNASPEVINFALDHLPDGAICVPGQHDLPYHNYDDISRSAYWTLVKCGKINNLVPNEPLLMKEQDACFWGFPWGNKLISPYGTAAHHKLQVAVCHGFVWSAANNGYPGAPPHRLVRAIKGDLKDFDVAIFGDNHKHFKAGKIYNCGGLMRRKVDEADSRPCVGLLHRGGRVLPLQLSTDGEKFIEQFEVAELLDRALDMTEFANGLRELAGGGDALNFKEAITRFMQTNKVGGQIKEIILSAMD